MGAARSRTWYAQPFLILSNPPVFGRLRAAHVVFRSVFAGVRASGSEQLVKYV